MYMNSTHLSHTLLLTKKLSTPSSRSSGYRLEPCKGEAVYVSLFGPLFRGLVARNPNPVMEAPDTAAAAAAAAVDGEEGRRLKGSWYAVGKHAVLVPYLREHVLRYHEWMQDPELLDPGGHRVGASLPHPGVRSPPLLDPRLLSSEPVPSSPAPILPRFGG
jgi:hypothetical protein